MYPILYQIGPFTLYSLWIFFALGLFAGLFAINKLIKQRLIKLNFLANHSIFLFFCSLIMARIFFIAMNYSHYLREFSGQTFLEIIDIADKGLSIWGGLIGLLLSLFYVCKKEKENFWAWSDVILPSIIFAMIFTNIGAFLDGKNYGSPTELPWGVVIETSQYAIPIHPVQIYASIYNLLISLFIFSLFNKNGFKKEGNVTLLTITLYSFFRFLDEFLRGDESFQIYGIRSGQLIALLILIVSANFMLKKYRSGAFHS